MRPLTESIPKALVPVLGRPFVDWQLELLTDQGVDRVTYCVGYRSAPLRAHVGDGSRYGVSVTWVDEGEQLRGTAGALRLAYEEDALDDAFFVLYGDSYLPLDMRAVEAAWRKSGLPALMTVLRNDDRWDASNTIYADETIVLYDKSRPEQQRVAMRWIDYGLSVVTDDLVATMIPTATKADLAELMRDLSVAGSLAGFEVHERFFEVGSPAGLRDLEDHLSRLGGTPRN
jgi:MurNAc alpha-1-phosphate uridylyltransferase